MDINNLDEEQMLELQKKFEENRKIILSMDPEEFLERIIKLHDSTDVILEGYDLSTDISGGQGISMAGIIRLRNALMDSVEWITNNLTEEDSEEEL
jgi:archaellum biogenesis ATPase FlaH